MTEFDVHLGVQYWDTVSIGKADDDFRLEIIHIPTSEYINICFINTGHGTPFVSVLELRPLGDNIYNIQSGSLDRILRWNLGSTTDDYVRYKDDSYDRIWVPREVSNTTQLSTLSDVDTNNYEIPPKVMNTAITPTNASANLTFYWLRGNNTFYIYTHFAEVETLKPNQSRTFNLYLNGDLWYGPFSPPNVSSFTVYSESPQTCNGDILYEVTLTRTENSTLPPIINALEVYKLISLVKLKADENDYEALMNITSTYNVTRNWQGDPCEPEDFVGWC